jgi:predicted nucleotidyltransferase
VERRNALDESNIKQKILLQIEERVRNKVVMKRGYRKKLKKNLERFLRKILSTIFSSSNVEVKRFNGDSSFGYDEFGRDIEDGLHKYVSVLENRGLKVHTVIVLGSRAKGLWTPRSDVDVTIIATNLPKEGRNFLSKRLLNLKRRIILSDRPLYLGIEPSGCCSRDEFLERLRSFDIQALDAIFYGRIIYDDGFWNIAKTQYTEIERKYGLNPSYLKKLLLQL